MGRGTRNRFLRVGFFVLVLVLLTDSLTYSFLLWIITPVKEVGLLIDLYQSPTQEESIFKCAVSNFFIPLIKLVKSLKNVNISLNIPLSTLELLDNYGYQSVILDVRDLYENDRIEIVGSAAYNPLLTRTHPKIVENEIILNEYALGSYFGAKQGFEGEPSIMIKNIEGFLPTGLLVNTDVLNILDDLSYTWVLVDGNVLPSSYNNNFVYKYSAGLKLVIPNIEIGNLVNQFNIKSFDEIWESMKNIEKTIGDKIIILINNDIYHSNEITGPDFYKKKMSMIDQLIENFCRENISIISIRDVVKNFNPKLTSELKDLSTFIVNENIYENAYSSEGKLQNLLKRVERKVESSFLSIQYALTEDDFSTISMWKDAEVRRISDNNIHNKVSFYALLYKYVCADKYIDAYRVNGIEAASNLPKVFLGKYMTYLRELIKYRSDEVLTTEVLPLAEDIENAIK